MSMKPTKSQQSVTSHNQSGGVTAVNVTGLPSTSQSTKPSEPKEKKVIWKRVLVAIGAVLAVGASLVAILEYFGLNIINTP